MLNGANEVDVTANSSLRDGWHDLPGGGAVEMKGGIPVRVSDKGHRTLDEAKILSAAAQLTGTKLTWGGGDRAKRWRPNNLLTVFRRDNFSEWCLARVLVAVCELCGDEVGTRWVKLVGESDPGWVGESCARESSEIER
jgi:hypothetical protein